MSPAICFPEICAKTPLFVLFMEIGYVTNLPTTYCMVPDTQNHHDLVLHKLFSHSFLSDFLATMCS